MTISNGVIIKCGTERILQLGDKITHPLDGVEIKMKTPSDGDDKDKIVISNTIVMTIILWIYYLSSLEIVELRHVYCRIDLFC